MDKALLKQEGMYLAACSALFESEYMMTKHISFMELYRWFSTVLKNCTFPDAHVFKAADFKSPGVMLEKLQNQNSPFCGLYLFLVGCMAQSVQNIYNSYTTFKYKYAVLFMRNTTIKSKNTIFELANAGCGWANFIKFAQSNYEDLNFLNKALIGNSHDAILHLINNEEKNQKVQWIWCVRMADMGLHYSFIHNLMEHYSSLSGSCLFFAGQGVNCFITQISADYEHYDLLCRVHHVYVKQLACVKNALQTCSICLLRKRIYKDVRVLIAKAIWNVQSDEAWFRLSGELIEKRKKME